MSSITSFFLENTWVTFARHNAMSIYFRMRIYMTDSMLLPYSLTCMQEYRLEEVYLPKAVLIKSTPLSPKTCFTTSFTRRFVLFFTLENNEIFKQISTASFIVFP